METDFKSLFLKELKSFFELKKTERLWHIPVLASLCVGIPLLIGYFTNRLEYGLLASTSGLVILHLPTTTVARRMITLLACSFGFMISYTIGLIFSFNPIISALVIGIFSVAVHWIVRYFEMKPPSSFFFIMLASVASCMPFDPVQIPTRVGLVGMGAMLACLLAFVYSLYITQKYPPKDEVITVKKVNFSNFVESLIIGAFMALSLLVGHLLKLQNPYWLPISCAAVLQGMSLHQVWQRSVQRILGTFVGLGLTWLLLKLQMNELGICLSIMGLQFMIEMLIVRHYGLAVIFMTPLTIFLAEASHAMSISPDTLIQARWLDITLGSIIGGIAAFFLYHRKIRARTEQQIRKTGLTVLRR